ncbi:MULTISPECIES: carbon-nitrogen hydrolase family protein [Legionella]|uniref:Carbon-nitrogen hydrolase family protein n=1 Tax=Legionella septentrionalis TaxID=2498109 RepID=A0A3S0V9E7_9GAMM|nr:MULTISPECIES: carbon-nitrogen hydrolase family protein [Legionella]MCP0913431.1 carbon-nitrogen hydrolase family protein [Legionella sp. 27cVA30]RUQ80609.1 carbon-nitrogen hydrolase family protein [Legionella septentrionalis]RUQ99580.1 carbon-nitrogen hydrolase family protein [Legionella septentrionalis]RUR09834.1 carbon-nitrogen hydrolase family protein [Legionella septentrionalis]RUR12784.1 carbon-nitrogen hydrolase family protein [Legionella septentrionalis]
MDSCCSKVRLLLLALLLLGFARLTHADSSQTLTSFKAAAVAYDPAWGDLHGNIKRMVEGVAGLGKQGVKLAVLPETANMGYIFADFDMVRPYLDTVPGKATTALAEVTRKYHMYVAVGLGEFDPASGLAYNTSALVGPQGYIGKYRKHGLNAQDQRWAVTGNGGFPVFDTELGRISLLICYDDTYWQYARLALLHQVDIIAWSSVSDRVMPGTPAAKAKGDHSTIASVQHLSADTGAWVVAATRNGIETNPITKQQLYYNGGSSIWDPLGNKVAQLPVLPPQVLPSGVHGVAVATIMPAKSAPVRAKLLKRRRPEMYGILALHRAPTDPVNGGRQPQSLHLTIEAGDLANSATAVWSPPKKNGLAILPILFHYGPNLSAAEYRKLGEPQGGPSEKILSNLARQGQGYVVGSYPERTNEAIYHTVALAEPSGKIIARYRATHLGSSSWAMAGNQFIVVPTPIGRIALVLGEELAVPEVYGVYSALRADILAAPSGSWQGETLLQIDPKLYTTPYPPGTPYAPYSAAKMGQFWVAAAGWGTKSQPSAFLLGPEPVIATPPHAVMAGDVLNIEVTAPWPGTWINQQQLIGGQQPWNTLPLVLAKNNPCLATWSHDAGWNSACW